MTRARTDRDRLPRSVPLRYHVLFGQDRSTARSLVDHIGHDVWLGHEYGMAGRNFGHLRADPLCHVPQQRLID